MQFLTYKGYLVMGHGILKVFYKSLEGLLQLSSKSLTSLLQVSYRYLSSLLKVSCNFLPVADKSHTGVMGHGVGVMGSGHGLGFKVSCHL